MRYEVPLIWAQGRPSWTSTSSYGSMQIFRSLCGSMHWWQCSESWNIKRIVLGDCFWVSSSFYSEGHCDLNIGLELLIFTDLTEGQRGSA